MKQNEIHLDRLDDELDRDRERDDRDELKQMQMSKTKQ